jgi:perosamine synthetase
MIEDATESLGSLYRGRKTGSFGTMGCFSFNGNKIITTGGGGMIVTDDESKAARVRHLSTQAKRGGIEYHHDEVGFNYRLSNVAAAIGVAQFERIDEFVRIKRDNARFYRDAVSDISGVDFLWEKPFVQSNCWFYTLRVEKQHKNPIIQAFSARDIQVRPIWELIHTLPMYRDCERYDIKHAIEAYDRCINIPCSVGLARGDQEQVVDTLKKYFIGRDSARKAAGRSHGKKR